MTAVRREHADVAIVGGGPAGLAAAIELRRLGVGRVVVLEREREAGGVPRHTDHTGFGLRDLHRVLRGPAYAARYRRLADAAGVEVRSSTTATDWRGPRTLALTSPAGLAELTADAVILAAGCRERPRSARLVAGDRPPGVLTTGALQQLVYLHGAPVGRRAVVVGAEHVSFSAVLTLAHAGVETVAMVTAAPRQQSYAALAWLAARRRGVPILTGAVVKAISGRPRVAAVMVTDVASGAERELPCDTVVFTGDWIPDHELARRGGLVMDAATRAPRVDGRLRTSAAGVFAAGNLVHAAETADVAALSGRHAARAAQAFLAGRVWPTLTPIPIVAAAPILWVSPSAVAGDASVVPRDRFLLRVDRFVDGATIEVRQDGRVLWSRRYRRLVPARSISAAAGWVTNVAPNGGPVVFRVVG